MFSGSVSKQARYPKEMRRTLASIRKFGCDALNLSVSKFCIATSDNPVTAHRSRMVILFVLWLALNEHPDYFLTIDGPITTLAFLPVEPDSKKVLTAGVFMAIGLTMFRRYQHRITVQADSIVTCIEIFINACCKLLAYKIMNCRSFFGHGM